MKSPFSNIKILDFPIIMSVFVNSNVNMEIDVCKRELIRFLIVDKDESVSNH
jgi:hypothetical protein